MTTRDKEQTGQEPHAVPWLVYQQVAAVLGAIGLAATLGNFADLDWRGFLATVLGYWDEYVRPAMKSLLELLVATPLRWAFGWNIQFPLLLRDYLASGIILALSMAREVNRYMRGAPGRQWREVLNPFEIGRYDKWAQRPLWLVATWLPIIPLVWPLSLAVWLLGFIIPDMIPRERPFIVRSFLIISPLIYLGALVTLNYLVLR